MTQRPEPASYVVEGQGEFPLDMLRKDGSWPAGQADALAMNASPERSAPKRRVTLFTLERFITEARWESFGWRVVTPPAPYNPAVDRLKASLAQGLRERSVPPEGMVTVPVMLDLHRIPLGQVQDVAFLARIENALIREFGDELRHGAGVVAVAVARGSHEMTTTDVAAR